MSTVSPQGLKPPASGSVDTYVKANLLPGASKVRGDPGHCCCSLATPRLVTHLSCPAPPSKGLDIRPAAPHCWDVHLGILYGRWTRVGP